MNKPIISIIAAIGQNRELGKNNKLLWHIGADMKRFKMLTTGHPVIMGRTTYESIGKPLPNRINIIITGNKNFKAEGCIICYSLENAFDIARNCDQEEIFVIGGGQIYLQAIDFADKLYLTVVDGTFDADTYFPDYTGFNKVAFKQKGQENGYNFTFLELASK